MNTSVICRYAAGVIALTLSLTGCGGSQAPMGASGAIPQARAIAFPSETGRELLYVAAVVATDVYTFPHGKLVSGLGGSTGIICSNAAGDVFLSQANVDFIDEFQHGRPTPIAQLSDPFSDGNSCSVDPTSGNLALVSSAGEGVAIFRPGNKPHHWHLPKLYALAQRLISCGYDASGNLFIDDAQNTGIIYELPKGGSTFQDITLGSTLTTPGTVQWDGKYLAVGDQGNTLIHRFAIQGSQATQIGSVTLSGASSLQQLWIQGAIVIGAEEFAKKVDFWRYPKGGSEMKALQQGYYPLGSTVSRPN